MHQSLARFKAGYFERLWGGRRLRDSLAMDAPDGPIGEAWLVSDHSSHESEVVNGPWAGKTLHDLVVSYPEYLLGRVAKPTVHGRFPLLLKVLDADQVLSVQVHPDDAAARALDEPDVGKTEMWHVLEAEEDSTLICGLDPALDAASFLAAAQAGTIEGHMTRFPAEPGTTVFVRAGTVHAIGAGILLAEIQQNSDLTYRVHDWNRVDASGNARELHLEKAARVTSFGSAHGGAAEPLTYMEDGGATTVLGACPYFATELVEVAGTRTRETGGNSFHLVMPRDGSIEVTAGDERQVLARCACALVPAGAGAYTLHGHGYVLDYYVPDLALDIVGPLRAAGHSDRAITRLGVAVNPTELDSILDA